MRPGLGVPGGLDDIDNVVFDGVIDVYFFGDVLKETHVAEAQDGRGFGEGVLFYAVKDFEFFVYVGVIEFFFEEEAVELGFGEGVGSFLFNGVLCGDDDEDIRHFIRYAAYAGLMFLHGFQHGALGLGTGAVDFVEQDEVGVYGALPGFKGIVGVVEDLRADNIAGQEVWCALDPGKCAGYAFCEDSGCPRFCQSGNGFEQDMAIGHTGGEQGLGKSFLADDPFFVVDLDFIDEFYAFVEFVLGDSRAVPNIAVWIWDIELGFGFGLGMGCVFPLILNFLFLQGLL